MRGVEDLSKDSKALIGRGRICEYQGIGKKRFYTMVEAGLPARKIDGIWMAHADVRDEYVRELVDRDAV